MEIETEDQWTYLTTTLTTSIRPDAEINPNQMNINRCHKIVVTVALILNKLALTSISQRTLHVLNRYARGFPAASRAATEMDRHRPGLWNQFILAGIDSVFNYWTPCWLAIKKNIWTIIKKNNKNIKYLRKNIKQIWTKSVRKDRYKRALRS